MLHFLEAVQAMFVWFPLEAHSNLDGECFVPGCFLLDSAACIVPQEHSYLCDLQMQVQALSVAGHRYSQSFEDQDLELAVETD